jgi:CelD/BcsL family acetyltransferase involved in cellulose biosynthesis
LNIKVVKTISEFAELKTIWNSIQVDSENTHINSTFEWNWIWWSIYGGNKQLFILIISDNEKVIGIAPLCLSKSKSKFDTFFSINRLSFLGSGISDSLDFIIVKNHTNVVINIIDYIQNNCSCDEVRLMDVNINSKNFNQLFQSTSIGKFNVFSKKLYGTYSVQIRETFNKYFESLSSDQRRSLKKRSFKLRTKYNVTFDISKTIDDEFLNEFHRLEIERSKNKKHYKRNILLSTHFTKFLKELSKELPKGRIKIFKMLFDSKIIAYNIIFDFEKKLYAWLTSYDISFSKYSVGILVQMYALEYAFNKGYELFDFMRGDEQYKKFFHSEKRDNYSIFLYRQNFKMRIRLALLNVIKKLRSNLPYDIIT